MAPAQPSDAEDRPLELLGGWDRSLCFSKQLADSFMRWRPSLPGDSAELGCVGTGCEPAWGEQPVLAQAALRASTSFPRRLVFGLRVDFFL